MAPIDPPHEGDLLQRAIEAEAKREIERIFAEETERAGERVHERLLQSVPKMVMAVHRQYSMDRHGPEIVIRVKDEYLREPTTYRKTQ